MDFNQVITRAKAILLSPKTEWPVIAARPETVQSLYKDYLVIIAAIPAIAGFIRGSLIGISLPFGGTFHVGIVAGLVGMVIRYVFSLGLVYVLALIVDALAPNFGGQKSQIQALKTVGYAMTAGAVFSAGQIIPGFLGGVVAFAGGIYSLYLLYLGLPVMMKTPPEKAVGYTSLVIVASLVLGILFGVVGGLFGGVGRGPMMSDGHFDKDSTLGKMEDWSKKVEAANKDLTAAQQSGDAEAQKAAMGKMMGTVLGAGGAVESLPPDRIKSFLPDTLSGLARKNISAERNAAMGMQISNASATYSDDANKSLTLEITDMGSAKAFAALASWADVEQEKETDSGYEKTYKADGRTIHEQWDRQNKEGEYTLIVGGRFSVKVSGSADSIETLKASAESVDLRGLEALRDEGVKQGG